MAPAAYTATIAGKTPNSAEELHPRIKLEDLGVETRLNDLESLISETKGIAAKYGNLSRDVNTKLDRAGLLMGDIRLHRKAIKEASTLLKQAEEEKRRAEAVHKMNCRILGGPATTLLSTTPDLKRKRQAVLTPSPDEVRFLKPDAKKPRDQGELWTEVVSRAKKKGGTGSAEVGARQRRKAPCRLKQYRQAGSNGHDLKQFSLSRRRILNMLRFSLVGIAPAESHTAFVNAFSFLL